MPVMWEYDYFKARRCCCSAISDTQIGALAQAVDLPFAVPASNCLIISVTNWIERKMSQMESGRNRVKGQLRSASCFQRK